MAVSAQCSRWGSWPPALLRGGLRSKNQSNWFGCRRESCPPWQVGKIRAGGIWHVCSVWRLGHWEVTAKESLTILLSHMLRTMSVINLSQNSQHASWIICKRYEIHSKGKKSNYSVSGNQKKRGEDSRTVSLAPPKASSLCDKQTPNESSFTAYCPC